MKKPRILFYDIETSYVRVGVFRLGDNYITHEHILPGEKFDIICIAYRWAGQKPVYSLTWDRNQNSSAMVEKFNQVVQSADIVIGHNIRSFDIKQVNTQRILHGQGPIAWPTSEDTLKQFRKHFYFPSNKLDYLAKTLLGAGKARMSYEDWVQIKENKCQRTLRKMVKYCKRDVRLTEGVFEKARAWFEPQANRSIMINNSRSGCPNCGSLDVRNHGTVLRKNNRLQRMLCKSCTHLFTTKSLPLRKVA